GEQKDFYDLFLLAEKHGLEKIYNALEERNRQFKPGVDDNLFNLPSFKPKEDLSIDLSPLGNFNNATDKKSPGNRVQFTEGSPINMPLPVLKQKWITKIKTLANGQNLKFNETQKVRRRSNGLSL
ncbi:MAG TPA: hypothetical protein VFQ86_05470, partial [Arachidicoccus soli]|nr:hypothetical protein [Arachidicoccus soli]